MRELEALSAAGGSKDALVAWIAASCKPVDRKKATKITDFKKAAAAQQSVCEMQIGPILTAAGISPQGVTNSEGVRVAVGAHPEWTDAGVPRRASGLGAGPDGIGGPAVSTAESQLTLRCCLLG